MIWIENNYSWRVSRVILLLVMMSVGPCVTAQTLEEWTKQKKLQTSYKLNQIAALSAYLEVAKKGYEIAKAGWSLAGDIQAGEYSLHTDYFGNLVAVHPLVRDYPIALEIPNVYRQINREVDWMDRFLADQSMLEEGEIMAVNRFNRGSKAQADVLMDELHELLSSDSYAMDDGERLAAIDGLYAGIQQLFQGLNVYNGRIRSLDLHRKRKETQHQQLNSFYDVR
ncbi:hypothetical protein [Algoriphagus yeomjeoni]|uniref:TerB family tellurite resistance protein n=1 Tax=Algoriphagus yeomjeoni TaxID=291403 RepID=A0A327P4U5_9BACT|nr:hypothetical protein [Algoriphagus yeomjeoni]RAI86703.1 hypothetical protein LV83_03259 [Algoriphagus yeomjeoni]